MEKMDPLEDSGPPSGLKACMNFKWTDELTMQFILFRNERRQTFTKKRNTSRHGWQQILRDMGLLNYVTPYQAQKKWNNLWSKYKLAKRAQTEGVSPENDPNGQWPFFTVLDAIATGKTVVITNPGNSNNLSTVEETDNGDVITAEIADEPAAPDQLSSDEPAVKRAKVDSDENATTVNSKDPQIVELLQANLLKLDDIKQSIETQGQNIASMLSQLIQAITNNKSTGSSSEGNRIDEAISATIREIGIHPDQHV